MKYTIIRLICKCGNMIDAWVDEFRVYYCDVCDGYHEINTEE